MLKISVGRNDFMKTFHVYRGLLCFHSVYFKNMLNEDWREDGSDDLELTNVKVKIFQMFYDWMNTGEFSNTVGLPLTAHDIIDLYVFADYYDVQQLRNRVLDVFFLFVSKVWEAHTPYTTRIYNDTAEASSLRKLHVDILLQIWSFEDWESDMNNHPKEFLADLLETCRKKKIVFGSVHGMDNDWDAYMNEMRTHFCENYHEHSEAETRSAIVTSYVFSCSCEYPFH